jgi:heptosyltransferase-3
LEILQKKTRSNKVVVLPCRGIGDAVLMMIASERLRQEGFDVTTVHPKLPELQPWFPGHQLASEVFFSEDAWIVVENDNSERIQLLKDNYRKNLTIFYPTYVYRKHGALTKNDRIFDAQKSMAENIALATASLLHLPSPSKHNGITPPEGLHYRKHRHRVVIHHTSSSTEKNWLKEKYDEVAQGLEKRGFEPVFSPEFSNLSELAAFVYESGFVIGNDSLLGHLASNLHIPTLIIADKTERMQLWRPGWLQGQVITLANWLPRWKFFERHWQHFITPTRVLKAFDSLSTNF